MLTASLNMRNRRGQFPYKLLAGTGEPPQLFIGILQIQQGIALSEQGPEERYVQDELIEETTATIMPIGDVLVVAQHGVPTPIIALHVAVGLILLITWFLLRRWINRTVAEAASLSQ